jgi:hypothetical protein
MLKTRYIYIASSWENRFVLRPVRDKLIALGHVVTSRWIAVGEVDYPADIGAGRDIADLDASNTLVFWPDNMIKQTSGKFVEYGYALAAGHEIYIVQPESTTCIFAKIQRPYVHTVADFDTLYKILES